MLKETYHRMNEHIHAPDTLIRDTLATTDVPSSQTRRSWKAVPVMICLLCLLLAGTALAATPYLSAILARHYPDRAGQFQPVNQICEQGGITLEIVQAYVKDGAVNIVAGLRGEGVDEHTRTYFDLHPTNGKRFVSIEISGGFFDEETGTQYYVLSGTGEGDRPLAVGDTLTVSIFNLSIYNNGGITVYDEIDLTALSVDPPTKTVQATGLSFSDAAKDIVINPPSDHQVLIPTEPIIQFTDQIAVTAAGLIDGKLHVQTRTPRIPLTYETSEIRWATYERHSCLAYLANRGATASTEYTEEEMLLMETKLSWTDESEDYFYNEYIFRPAADELDRYVLRTVHHTSGEYPEGEWSVTFTLTEPDT